MANEPLARAIRAKGSQAALADAIGVGQSHVWYWLKKSADGVPAPYCAAIERETGIPRHELRPDLWEPPAPASTAERAA